MKRPPGSYRSPRNPRRFRVLGGRIKKEGGGLRSLARTFTVLLMSNELRNILAAEIDGSPRGLTVAALADFALQHRDARAILSEALGWRFYSRARVVGRVRSACEALHREGRVGRSIGKSQNGRGEARHYEVAGL